MKKILGIGNALTDILVKAPDYSILEKYGFEPGSMNLIEDKLVSPLSEATANLKKQYLPGGCAANTIRGLARMGNSTGFIGKIGKDSYGDIFKKGLKKLDVTPHLSVSEMKSGCAFTIIPPDKERTFATYLGAAFSLSPDDISRETIKEYDLAHIEGYLVQNHELVKRIMNICNDTGTTVSLDLASFNIVQENLGFLRDITENYVDIIFANEDEATAYADSDISGSVDHLSEACDLCVVKLGSEGSIVASGGKKHVIPPINAEKVDSTGAGDLYAAGFLHEWLNGSSA
ncbi:MAG: adenosine kinase, partial [bacterium]